MKETDWLARHFQLTEEQCRRFDELMTMSVSKWPSELYTFCYERSLRFGFSGDMLADTVAEWIAKGNIYGKHE